MKSKNAKRVSVVAVAFLMVAFFSGCSVKNSCEEVSELIMSTTKSDATEVADENKEECKETDIDTYIVLNDSSTTIIGSGAAFRDGVLTISKSGNYSIKGKLSDGNIIVNSEDDGKVKLYFNGVSIYSSTTAPINIQNAKKEVKIILVEDSVNKLSDNSDRPESEDGTDIPNAVIYSKDDLQIEGCGSLSITANYNKGIFSKNDIQISSGTIDIKSVDDAIRGKDSVEISDGTLNLTCGGDGIRTNSDEDDKGNIEIKGGTITINSDLDAIQATGEIEIYSGSFKLTSGVGAEEGSSNSKDKSFYNFGGFHSQQESSSSDLNDTSTKGIKADGEISISGGTFVIDSADDAIHAGGDIAISRGSYTISSGDDGIHSDKSLEFYGGNITISKSYEGIEAQKIIVKDGTIKVTASDDGFNAASKSQQSEGTKQDNPFDTDSDAELEISGGTVYVNADGDGLDSNGEIKISDGKVYVFGPSNDGNCAMDFGISCSVTGGTVLAVGTSGMNEGLGNSSPYINLDTTVSSGTVVTVTDSKNNEILSFTTKKETSNIMLCTEDMKEGESYNVYIGGSHTGTVENGVYVSGTAKLGEQQETVTASANQNIKGGNSFGNGPGGGSGKPDHGNQPPQGNPNT